MLIAGVTGGLIADENEERVALLDQADRADQNDQNEHQLHNALNCRHLDGSCDFALDRQQAR